MNRLARLWHARRQGQRQLADRLALLAALAGTVVLTLLAVIVSAQAQRLALHDRSVQGLHFGRHVDRLLLALARERELAQAAATGERGLQALQVSARGEVDAAQAALSGFVARSTAVRQAIGQDEALTHLPDYLQRLRARVDQTVMREDTAVRLYTLPVRQLFRIAAQVEERCIAPALGSRTHSLVTAAMLVEEFARQASALRRMEHASQGGVLTQDRLVVTPLLDAAYRADHLLAQLMAHTDPTSLPGRGRWLSAMSTAPSRSWPTSSAWVPGRPVSSPAGDRCWTTPTGWWCSRSSHASWPR